MLKKLSIYFAYFSYVLYQTGLLFGISTINDSELIRRSCSILAVAMLFFSLVLCHKIKLVSGERGFYVFILLFLLIGVISQDFLLIFITLFYINIENFDISTVFKISFFSLLLSTSIIVLLSYFGIIENVTGYRNSLLGVVLRNTFGFKWFLCLPDVIVYLCIYYTIYKKSFTVRFAFLFVLISVVLFYYCDSKLALFSSFLATVMYFSVRFIKTKYYHLIMYYLSFSIFPTLTLVSYYFLYMFSTNDPTGVILNEILTDRLALTYYNLQLYPILPLNVTDISSMKQIAIYVIDSGYFYLGFRYGFLSYIFFSILCFYISKYFWITKNIYGLTSFILILIMSFIDNNFMGYGFLPFYLVGAYSFKRFFICRSSNPIFAFQKLSMANKRIRS